MPGYDDKDIIMSTLPWYEEYLNDCWIYEIKTDKWSIVEFAGKYPPPIGHHCCCLALERDQLINDTFTIYHKPTNNRKTFPLLKIDGLFFFGGINNNKIIIIQIY